MAFPMARHAILPRTAPFEDKERASLDAVLGKASPTQRAWLAGFLAGLDAAGGQQAAVPAAPPKAVNPQAPPNGAAPNPNPNIPQNPNLPPGSRLPRPRVVPPPSPQAAGQPPRVVPPPVPAPAGQPQPSQPIQPQIRPQRHGN